VLITTSLAQIIIS